ncbi:MAG: hypothetical protein OXU68_02340, partial [Bacteroidota bacterium]|nr:hypothetical protein [Bacteroidota bacterium]
MKKEDCTLEIFERSVSSSNGLHFLDLTADSFRSGIGLLTAKCITDPLSVWFKHLGDLDDLLYGLLLPTVNCETQRSKFLDGCVS